MKLSAKLFIHAPRYSGGPYITACDMTEYGHTLLGTQEVELDFEMPDEKEIINLQIGPLRQQKTAILAAAQAKADAIDMEIGRLLCLESR